MNKIISLLVVFSVFNFSCTDSNLPKQRAFLRIEFPEPSYSPFAESSFPVDFYYNSAVTKINNKNFQQLSLNYPKMNFAIDLSFNKINKLDDLDSNLSDFSIILDTHSKKSNGIFIREYEDLNDRVFGKIYEIRGDVASPIQFYITDSTSNFMSGSLNLKSKSKYDSIFPSIQYIKNDILVLVESLSWKYK